MNNRILKFGRALVAPLVVVMTLTFSACGGGVPLTFSPDTLYPAVLFQTYSITISVSGNITPVNHISISSGALPDGLKLYYQPGDNTAAIKGDPTLNGTFTFTVSARCEGTNRPGQSGSHTYKIDVTRD